MPAPPPARPPTVLTLWPEALPHISSKAPREAGGSMGSSWDHQGGLHGGVARLWGIRVIIPVPPPVPSIGNEAAALGEAVRAQLSPSTAC